MTVMPFDDLEQVYEMLALAVDQAGPANESVFLAKLVLTLAHRTGDLAAFRESVRIALDDLPVVPPPDPTPHP